MPKLLRQRAASRPRHRTATPAARASARRAAPAASAVPSGSSSSADVEALERRGGLRRRHLGQRELRPTARLSQAMPGARAGPAATATSRLSRLASSRLASVTRARRDDARDLALDRPLARRRVADLLADRHRFAEAASAARGTARPRGTARRPSGSARRPTAPRAVSVMSSSARRALGVVVEELVEIAHPVEEQLVRMLRLDAQVLLHHRRVAGTGGRRLACRGCHGAVPPVLSRRAGRRIHRRDYRSWMSVSFVCAAVPAM